VICCDFDERDNAHVLAGEVDCHNPNRYSIRSAVRRVVKKEIVRMKKTCGSCKYGRSSTNPFDKIIRNMLWCSNSKSSAFRLYVGDKFGCGAHEEKCKRAPLWMLAAAFVLKMVNKWLRK
jgi:hypothetical protein